MQLHKRSIYWRFILPILSGIGLSVSLSAAPLQRVPNTTLQMPPSPPVYGYGASNAFGTLTFNYPIGIVSAPGETNRLFIIEKLGRIIAITNLAAPTPTVFLDISSQVLSSASVSEERGLLGLA